MGTTPKARHAEPPEAAIRRLTDRINQLEKQLQESNATACMAGRDVEALGKENARLTNALNAARETFRQNNLPKSVGRPTVEHGYEFYLYRETMEMLTRAIDPKTGECSITEKQAYMDADRRIRETAHSLNVVGWAAELKHLAREQPSADVVGKTWRNAKKKFTPPRMG